jgi:hypothetical protein
MKALRTVLAAVVALAGLAAAAVLALSAGAWYVRRRWLS